MGSLAQKTRRKAGIHFSHSRSLLQPLRGPKIFYERAIRAAGKKRSGSSLPSWSVLAGRQNGWVYPTDPFPPIRHDDPNRRYLTAGVRACEERKTTQLSQFGSRRRRQLRGQAV